MEAIDMQTDIQWPVPGTEWMEKGAVCRERERPYRKKRLSRLKTGRRAGGVGGLLSVCPSYRQNVSTVCFMEGTFSCINLDVAL